MAVILTCVTNRPECKETMAHLAIGPDRTFVYPGDKLTATDGEVFSFVSVVSDTEIAVMDKYRRMWLYYAPVFNLDIYDPIERKYTFRREVSNADAIDEAFATIPLGIKPHEPLKEHHIEQKEHIAETWQSDQNGQIHE